MNFSTRFPLLEIACAPQSSRSKCANPREKRREAHVPLKGSVITAPDQGLLIASERVSDNPFSSLVPRKMSHIVKSTMRDIFLATRLVRLAVLAMQIPVGEVS